MAASSRIVSVLRTRAHLSRTRAFLRSNGPSNANAGEAGKAVPKQKGFSMGERLIMVPATAAVVGLCLYQVTQAGEKPGQPKPLSPLSMSLWTHFPFKGISHTWGVVTAKPLPEWAREPVYRLWTVMFGCNLEEMKHPLKSYESFADFFARPLKDGIRPQDNVQLTSPVDGRVMSYGDVDGDTMDQVKGIKYSVSEFLGREVSPRSKQTKLMYIILYLSPGDYHNFHSPCTMVVNHRDHFPGQLFSVSPFAMRKIPALLSRNERVVLHGEWDQGYIGYAAVGACNVGSIKLLFDKVTTNLPGRQERSEKEYADAVTLKKGDEMGGFRLGSTVVLVVECSHGSSFNLAPGDKGASKNRKDSSINTFHDYDDVRGRRGRGQMSPLNMNALPQRKSSGTLSDVSFTSTDESSFEKAHESLEPFSPAKWRSRAPISIQP